MRDRILTLDLIRGYLLCVITIDHLFRFPGLFDFFTGRGQLWVSAAEGFFIISGILVGKIYNAKIVYDLLGVTKKLWGRAGKLYLCSIALTILFTIWGKLAYSDHIKSGLWTGRGVGSFVMNTLTLRYTYGWTDFLPYYSVFMLAAPAILYMIAKKKSWLVLGISAAVWLVGRNNMYLGWQLLFTGGIAAGCYLPKLEEVLGKHIKLTTAVTAVTIMMSVIIGEASSYFWFDKNTLGPGRVVLAGIWFVTFYLIIRRYENKIDLWTRGIFRTLGENSLLVYSLHGFVVFLANILWPFQASWMANIFINLTALIVIYTVTRGWKLASDLKIKNTFPAWEGIYENE